MTEPTKTAIVTGGASGIGLSLVRHLLSQTTPTGTPLWHVIIADIAPLSYNTISASLDPSRHKFIVADVSSWSSQASLFKEAYAYCNGRIDFLAANAGIAEREHLTLGNPLEPEDADGGGEPKEPSMQCTMVNQVGVFWGVKLFVWYARRTRKARKLEGKGDDGFDPKIVITSSCSALYPFAPAVQYAATKAAVLSLTRSLGPLLYGTDEIALNCIMPAYVDTGLTPDEVTALWPREWITPLSTMVRAYEELLSSTGTVHQDGKSDGRPDVVKVGQSIECVVDRLFYRKPVEYADESQRFIIEQGMDVENGVWWRGMRARLEKMIQQSQEGRTSTK